MAAWNEIVKLNNGLIVGVLAASVAGGIGLMSNVNVFHAGSAGGSLAHTTGANVLGWTSTQINTTVKVSSTLASAAAHYSLNTSTGTTNLAVYLTEDVGVRFECNDSTDARTYDFQTYIGSMVSILKSGTTGQWTVGPPSTTTTNLVLVGSFNMVTGSAAFTAHSSYPYIGGKGGNLLFPAGQLFMCGGCYYESAWKNTTLNNAGGYIAINQGGAADVVVISFGAQQTYNGAAGSTIVPAIIGSATFGGSWVFLTNVITPAIYGSSLTTGRLTLRGNLADSTTGGVDITSSLEAAVGGTGALTVAGGIYVTKALFGGSTAQFVTSVSTPKITIAGTNPFGRINYESAIGTDKVLIMHTITGAVNYGIGVNAANLMTIGTLGGVDTWSVQAINIASSGAVAFPAAVLHTFGASGGDSGLSIYSAASNLGLTVTGTGSANIAINTQAVVSADSRNYALANNYNAAGRFEIFQSAARGGVALGGTVVASVQAGIWSFPTSIITPLIQHSASTGGNLVMGNNIADSAAQFNLYGADGTIAAFTPFLALRTNTFAAGDISLRFILDTTSTTKRSYICSSFGDGTACGLHFTAYQLDVGGYDLAGAWTFPANETHVFGGGVADAVTILQVKAGGTAKGAAFHLIPTTTGAASIANGAVGSTTNFYSSNSSQFDTIAANYTSAGAWTFSVSASSPVINAVSTSGDANLVINAATNCSPLLYFKENNATKWYYFNDASNDRLTLLDSNGDAGVYIAQNATAWTAYSDRRLKRLGSIRSLDNCLATIMKIDPVYFQYKKDSINSIARQGFIAQDVFKVFPYAVDVGMTEKCMWGVTPTNFIPLLIGSVKELKKENDLLRSRIEQLERRLAA